MIIHRDILQHTPEWDAIRKGKMTASHAQAIGNVGKGLDTYIRDVVREMIVTTPTFKNSDMDRGNELESAARMLYEIETGMTVEEVGFVSYNDYVGYSPDGLVGDEGLVEIKARNNEIHFDLILDDSVDSKTIWQMQAGMVIANRQWCDFVSYNPNFIKQPLYRKRYYLDSMMKIKLLQGFQIGEEMIKKLLSQEPIKKLLTI